LFAELRGAELSQARQDLSAGRRIAATFSVPADERQDALCYVADRVIPLD
jgi:hypothetical protein